MAIDQAVERAETRIRVPSAWGGEGLTQAEAEWNRALDALGALGRFDPVIHSLVWQIWDAHLELTEEAFTYGAALGPDKQPNLDDVTDEEYVARTGRPREETV